MRYIPAAFPRYYRGLDISEAQFPSTPEDIDFAVQDITKPPLLQDRNRYDLVHVRMLVGAIKESDFGTVLAHLMTLLSKSLLCYPHNCLMSYIHLLGVFFFPYSSFTYARFFIN